MSVYSDYQRERKRVKDLQAKLEAKGYFFNEDIIPATPKTITKGSINKLKSINLTTLYKKANIVFEDGSFISGTEALKYELDYKKNKKQERVMARLDYYNTIYDNFIHGMSKVPSPVFQALSNTIKQFERQLGKERVAIALEEMPESFYQVLAEHRYDSEASVSDFTSRLLAYVPDLGRLEREQLSDIIEEYSLYDEPL